MPDQHSRFAFLQNRELDELYISIGIRRFAVAIIGIFIPIYLLEAGFSILVVFSYFAFKNLVHAFLTLPTAHLCNRIGFKHSMALSAPLLVFVFLLLFRSGLSIAHLPFIALLQGLQAALYWTGYHLDFSTVSKSTSCGKAVGGAYVVAVIFHALGPLIGGILITKIGYTHTSFAISALMLLSSLPLLLTKDGHVPVDHPDIFKLDKRMWRDALGFTGYGMESAAGTVLWPVFVFLTIAGSYTVLGSMVSVGIMVSAVAVWFLGKYSQAHGINVLRVGVGATIIAWIIRQCIRTPLQVYAVDSYYGLSRSVVDVPNHVISYQRANKSDVAAYVVMREVSIQIGRSLVFLLAALIGVNLVSMSIGGAGALLLLLF